MIDVEAALAALSLDDRCKLLAGATNWRTHAFPDAGVPSLKMSDGPNGVRGEGAGPTATPGVVVPAGITLGATWDVDLVADVGDLLGAEAVRRRAHVLLGPTVNLHRTPVGGRTFECMSEDPELSGRLAARYVAAVQRHDVAVTVKHFIANDTEIDRMIVDVRADERTLRETYLRPFELAVRDGGAWGIMSSYNRLHGTYTASSSWLLDRVLRQEWGFDGFVVSDWFGAHDTELSVRAGLTIEMPAPTRVYGPPLAAAVERGDVDPADVEARVREVLQLINRTRADERLVDDPEESADKPDERALTRRAAIAGTVLLRNAPVAGGADGAGGIAATPLLPLDASRLRSVAIVGPNATLDRSMGGGSASLQPFGQRNLLDALTDRLTLGNGDGSGAGCEIVYEEGVRIDRMTPALTTGQTTTPDGAPGLQVEFFNGGDPTAPTVTTTTYPGGLIRFFGSLPDELDVAGFGARVRCTYTPDIDGPHDFGIVSTGGSTATATCEGVEHVIIDDPRRELPRSEEFFGYGHEEVSTTIECRAGVPVEIIVAWTHHRSQGFAALRIGARAPEPADLLDRAVAAAASADVAIVVAGTNDEWETEGSDRTMLQLPGRQDELIERVAAANPRTIVVVNAGSPVSMHWADADHPCPAPAVLTSFFAGQEQAEAMVDTLLGVAQPGGRLPITYPRRLEDTPAFLDHLPDRATAEYGVQFYAEGPFIGHRWYEARDIQPHFWFGHGLGYGGATWGTPIASAAETSAEALFGGESIAVRVGITAEASTSWAAIEVVQGYVASSVPYVRRPPRWLAAFDKLEVAPGEQDEAVLRFGADAFRRWDVPSQQWVIDPGRYEIIVARSADPTAEHARIAIDITAAST